MDEGDAQLHTLSVLEQLREASKGLWGASSKSYFRVDELLRHVPQRKPLIGIVRRNRRIHGCVSDRDAGRSGHHPPNMLIRRVPHLDPKGEVARDVVQVWISQLQAG